jgi:putative transposase
MEETTVYQYQIEFSKSEWAKVTEARREAGKLWTRLVKLHHFCRTHPNLCEKWPSESQLKAHFKGRFQLHSQTIQGVIEKFCAVIDGTRTKRKKGDKTARYPHRYKFYYNPIFKGQSLKLVVMANSASANNSIPATKQTKQKPVILKLPLGKGRGHIAVRLSNIPPGQIVQAELGYKTLYLTIKKKVAAPIVTTISTSTNTTSPQLAVETLIPTIKPLKLGGLDSGIIQLGVITDGEKMLAIAGRGIRSVKQGRAKAHAEIRRKLSRCKRGSRRYKKLKRAMYAHTNRAERITRNALHHAANQMVEFCQEQGIDVLYSGDLGNINQHTKKKRSKRANQDLGVWEFGRLHSYLEYKLKRIGASLVKQSEAYTSKTCPNCGHLNKVAKRTYKCRVSKGGCGYTAHRDGVGAVNILNKAVNTVTGNCDGAIVPGTILVPKQIKYSRPVALFAPPPKQGSNSIKANRGLAPMTRA